MLKTLFASLALVALSLPAGADIYKCRLASGNIEISNRPCSPGSSTLASRPDERVSEAARRQAEQEVERMRQYVEKRESSQRADDAAARDERAAAQQRSNANRPPPPPAHVPQRQSGTAEECLRNIESMVLEASLRAQMEADCRNIPAPQEVYVPPTVAPYPQPPHAHLPQNQLPSQMPTPKPEPAPSAPKIAMPPLQK